MPVDALSPFTLCSKDRYLFVGQSRSVEGLGYAPPASFQPSPNGSEREASLSAPLSERLRFPSVGQCSIVGAVRHLGWLVCPANIPFFVMSVIVDPVKTHARWTITKMGKEVLKVLKLYLYPASAIVFESLIFGICAARIHIAPCGIFSRTFSSLHAVDSHDRSLSLCR